MTSNPPPVLYTVVCGAGPASDIHKLLNAAQDEGWDVYVIATPAAMTFISPAAIEDRTGNPVRNAYRTPGQPRQSLPPADAVIVAPATFNTINKLAAGISDNYALGVLAECIGAGVPVVVLPFINSALAARAPLTRAIAVLRDEGVKVLLGGDGFNPHPPGQGGGRIADFPWTAALRAAETTSETVPP